MKTLLATALAAFTLYTGSAEAYCCSPAYKVQQSPFATYIAQKTGDILTIVIDEKAIIEDNGKAKLTKESSLLATLKKVFIPPFDPTEGFTRLIENGTEPGFEFESESEYNGKAINTANHKFEAKIQVRMIEEIRPGEFVVRGHRNVNINGKCKKLFVSGVVRQRDIDVNNSVLSHKLVDACVEIEGDVAACDLKPGWVTRVFNCIF